jgi:hypothetical protein
MIVAMVVTVLIIMPVITDMAVMTVMIIAPGDRAMRRSRSFKTVPFGLLQPLLS